MRRRAAALVLASAVLGFAACSGGAGSGTPTPSSSAPATPPASSAAPTTSAGPSLATLPATECLTGEWQLVRFVGAGGGTYGTGQGGDVTVRFEDGSYRLAGAGDEPITVTLGGGSAELRVDGDVEGRWTLDGSTATFTERSASGSAVLRSGEQKRALSMDQVANVVGLQGDGRVDCTADAMTITLQAVRLELGRA